MFLAAEAMLRSPGMAARPSNHAITGIITVSILLSQSPSLAQAFCSPQSLRFQHRFQSEAVPAERINGQNMQLCSSGLTCINQVAARIRNENLMPAAYEAVLRGKRRCLMEVRLPRAAEPDEPAASNEGEGRTSNQGSASGTGDASAPTSANAVYQDP